jgi:hypothetical protein
MYCTEMDLLPVFEMFTELKGLMMTSGGRCCIMNAAAHFSVVLLDVGGRRFWVVLLHTECPASGLSQGRK